VSATTTRRLGSVEARARAFAGWPGLPWVIFGLLIAAAGPYLLWVGRDNSFFYDDWSYLLARNPWTFDAIFEPHNEHLQATSVFVYKVLFETVGLRDYWVYQSVLVLGNLITGVLVFVYAQRRIGPWLAIPLVASIVLMSASWYNLFWPFMMCFTLTTAAGMGALLALDRRTRRGDVLASGLLCFALASSSLGVSFLIGAVIDWALRDDRRKRWWVVGVPVLLYGLWRLVYDPKSSARLHNAPEIPAYISDGYDEAVTVLLGFGFSFGVIAAAVLAVLVLRDFIDPERTTHRLVVTVAMALSFWALTALGRADQGVEADVNRYLYPAGILTALVIVEVARRYPRTRRATVALTAVLAAGAVSNVNGVESGGDQYRNLAGNGRAAATAMELAGHINPKFQEIDPDFPYIPAGEYLERVADYGPMGWTEAELKDVNEQERLKVDHGILRLLQAPVVELPADHPVAPEPPGLVRVSGGTEAVEDGCRVFTPAGGDVYLEVLVPPPGLIIRAGDDRVALRLRRFGPLVTEGEIGSVAANATGGIELAADKSRAPWIARLQSTAPFRACSSIPG
jgi:hypothetical protein